MADFTIYPAIDLIEGQVVRLAQGDRARRTVYDANPAAVAERWLAAGATWLHVVNLDGAFGLRDAANLKALQAVLDTGAWVQFGGGLRTLQEVEQLLALGVTRVVLGTAAIETPELASEAIQRFGPTAVAVGIDARGRQVRVRGWTEETGVDPVSLGQSLHERGLRTVIYTNIARDGVGTGVDVEATVELSAATGLDVIASGGVAGPADIVRVREAGLPGVIVGRALYENQIDLAEVLQC